MGSEDYVFQNIPYEEQIKKAEELIRETKTILIGAGAGASAAADLPTAENDLRIILVNL